MENSTTSREQYSAAFITIIFMDCLGLFLSVALNSFHLIVLKHSTFHFTGNFRSCLRTLAVFDILGGSICYGIEILVYFNRSIITSNIIRCNVAAATCTISVGFSQFTLWVITIDRYVAVTRPLRYYHILSSRRFRALLISALLVGMSVSTGRSIHAALINHCDFIEAHELFTLPCMAVYHVAPLSLVIVTTVLNMRLLCIARAQMKRDAIARQSSADLQSRDSTDAQDTEQNNFSERCKSALTVSAVVVASYMVWMPYLIITIVCLWTKVNLPFVGKAAMYWSIYATFWFNPIVFGLVSRNYKKAVLSLFVKMKNVSSMKSSQL